MHSLTLDRIWCTRLGVSHQLGRVGLPSNEPLHSARHPSISQQTTIQKILSCVLPDVRSSEDNGSDWVVRRASSDRGRDISSFDSLVCLALVCMLSTDSSKEVGRDEHVCQPTNSILTWKILVGTARCCQKESTQQLESSNEGESFHLHTLPKYQFKTLCAAGHKQSSRWSHQIGFFIWRLETTRDLGGWSCLPHGNTDSNRVLLKYLSPLSIEWKLCLTS